ncbi:MAG: alpha/beta hydrolase family esterase, partial [Acidimicrobiales bacterium]
MALGALLASSLSGCGGAVAAASAPPPSSNPGCGPSQTPSTQNLTLDIDGRQRVVVVHIPPTKGSADLPLVLSLHGSGNTAHGQEVFTGMDTTSDAGGFIVAYPQALIPVGTSGFDWNVPGASLAGGAPVPKNAPDDMTFIVTLVGILEQRYCVDPTRVYATGFSGGARLLSALACDESTVFAAVAPVSGLRRPTPCPTARPVPMISFHGTDDTIDPYMGGGQLYWTYSVPQAAAFWAQQDHCLSTTTLDPGDEYNRT